jgi:hypothetical protein
MEKIAVKVSTDKDQIVAALFLSPSPIEFSLKEHVNALQMKRPSWSIPIALLEVDRTRRVSEFDRRLIASTSFSGLVSLLRLQR